MDKIYATFPLGDDSTYSPPLNYLDNMNETSDFNNCHARGAWEEI